MNSRLTIQDLSGLLAEHTGKDKKDIELFLREFIAVISSGVCTDKLVKVKGFGAFKVILVENRESIHVNTGERFIIPQHYKFSFLPDKELRELVNKPFSFFETTELNENVDFSDLDEQEQTDEKDGDDESVEDLMPEGEELIIHEKPIEDKLIGKQTEELVEELAEPPMEELIEPLVEAPMGKSTEEPTEEPTEELTEGPIEEPAEKRVVDNSELPSSELSFFSQKPNAKSSISLSIKYLIAAVVAVILVFVAGFYANNRFYKTDVLKKNKADLVVVADSPQTVAVDTVAVVIADTVATPAPPPSPVLAKVKIEHGSRLTVIALEYYGSKVFWVYLYEYNKEIISNPNNIPVGTIISVPSPEIYGINAHDKASVAKAAVLQTELLSGKL